MITALGEASSPVGRDSLNGRLGDDLVHAGDGNDLYRFTLGDGYDEIDNQGDDSVIILDEAITPEAVPMTRTDNDLRICADDAGEEILIGRHFTGKPIEELQFADGTLVILPTNDAILWRSRSPRKRANSTNFR